MVAQRLLDLVEALLLGIVCRRLGALSLALALHGLARTPQRLLRVGLAAAAL